MNIQALNEFIIVEKIEEKENKFAMPESVEKSINETRKVKIVSVPKDLEKDIAKGDIVFIQSGALMNLEDFCFIKFQSIIGKEMK